MSASSPSSTLLPADLTLDVLWRHQAVAPLDDEALTRIARMAAALCGEAYVRISLIQGDALAPVARAGNTPSDRVAPPSALPITQQAMTPPHHPAVVTTTARAIMDTESTSETTQWRHAVAPVPSPKSAPPLGVIEAMTPASESSSPAHRPNARPVDASSEVVLLERLGDCAALVVTELQHRYNALRHTQTEEHLHQVAANVNSGLYRSTPEDGIIYANQAFIDLFGYDTLDEVLALPATALYATPAEQERLLRAEQAGNGLNQFPIELRRRDRTTFSARISSTIKRDAHGNVLYYDGIVTDVTEQQATEQALRRQEELFRILAENAQPVVFVLDAEGTFLLAEGRDLTAVGLEAEDVVGTSVFDRYVDFPKVLRGLRHALDGKEVRDTIQISGHVFDVWYSPLYNDGDTVVGCVGMVADVTEHRAAEEARLRSAERWERLVEAHPDPIVVSTQGRIRYINPAGVQVLGASHADQLIGSELFEFVVDEEKRMRAVERLRRVYKGTSSSLPTEYVIQWQDQAPSTVEVRSVPITYNSEPAAQTIVRDITRRREVEQTLRAERDLLERIFNTSAAAITVTNASGTIVEANERAEDVLGLSRCTLKGRVYNAPTWQIKSVSGEPFPENRLPFRQVKEEDQPIYDIQHALHWPDGTRKVVSINGAPLYDEDGVFAGGVFTVIDITDRVQAEHELRTAKQEAEAAARLKTAMLANMSHEVRTPLTSIMGFAEILTEEITGQPRRFADLITKSADRLLTTLDSVLRLAKLEAGTEVLTPKTLELRELVENIVQEKQQQAAEKNIALQLTCYAPAVHAHGGHGAMQRVVYNLLSNAIKFTASGGAVSLHLAQGPKAVLLEVMDTGIGMTQDFQARMFKAFTQESEGLAREHEGSGLGLAIVHELVDLMQGSIEVESTRGQGTRIAVFLPRASQETLPRA